jgi:hypothetical protein
LRREGGGRLIQAYNLPSGSDVRMTAKKKVKKSPYKNSYSYHRLSPTIGISLPLFLKSLFISFIYLLPVDNIPESLHIFWPPVLVFQVICMFPHVEKEQGSAFYRRKIH